MHFQPSRIFESKTGAYQSGAHFRCYVLEKSRSLNLKIKQGFNCLQRTNTLAYTSRVREKRFMRVRPGICRRRRPTCSSSLFDCGCNKKNMVDRAKLNCFRTLSIIYYLCILLFIFTDPTLVERHDVFRHLFN
jgi:hypothetical protein